MTKDKNPIYRAIFLAHYQLKDGTNGRVFDRPSRLAEAIENDRRKRTKLHSVLSETLRAVYCNDWKPMSSRLKRSIIQVSKDLLAPSGLLAFEENLERSIHLTSNMHAIEKTVAYVDSWIIVLHEVEYRKAPG